jgi:hypothetical protein
VYPYTHYVEHSGVNQLGLLIAVTGPGTLAARLSGPESRDSE